MIFRLVLAAAVAAALSGCAAILTTVRNDDHLLRTFDERSIDDEEIIHASVRSVARTPTGLRAEVEVRRAQLCTNVTHTVSVRTVVTDRTNRAPAWSWSLGILGTLGMGALGTGIALDATGTTPFISQVPNERTTDPTDMRGQPEAPLFLVIGGAILTPLVGVATGHGIAEIDSSEHVGEQDVVTTTTEECEERPADGVRVSVHRGRTRLRLGEATTDADGRASILLTPAGDGTAEVAVGGFVVETDVSALQRELVAFEQRRVAAAEAGRRRDTAAQEIASGRCSDGSAQSIEGLDQGLETLLRSANLYRVRHEMAVGTDAPLSATYRAPIGGTYHVIVASWRPVTVEIGRGSRAQTGASPYDHLVGSRGWETASAAFGLDAGDEFSVTVNTEGCFSLYVYYSLQR